MNKLRRISLAVLAALMLLACSAADMGTKESSRSTDGLRLGSGEKAGNAASAGATSKVHTAPAQDGMKRETGNAQAQADRAQETGNATQNNKNGLPSEATEENSSLSTANGFELRLFADRHVYKTTDAINLSATLKYIGDAETVRIWHGNPYIVFSITDGADFYSGGAVETLLIGTDLKKDVLYSFDYVKSGAYDANAPDADFWKDFYAEKELYLPAGEYMVSVEGAFSLSESVADSKSGLLSKLEIVVEAVK